MDIKELAQKKNWRINNLYKIRTKERELVTFNLNEAQKHYNENKAKRNIILKSRQLGFTTYEAIDSLDSVLWTKNFNALMISYDLDSATAIFQDKIALSWENYNATLKSLYSVDADRSNKLRFCFGENSKGEREYSEIFVKTSGRSGTNNKVHVSEFAKICKESPLKAKEIVSGTIPSVPFDGEIDIESTAEGEYGEFYDMFWEAWNRGEPTNPLEFKAHFYNWTWDKSEINKIRTFIREDEMEQGQKFREYFETLRKVNGIELTEQEKTYYYSKWLSIGKNWLLLQQEYPTTPEEAFITSGDKFFDIESLSKLKEEQGKNEGDITVFEDYKAGHIYAGGCDVSEGVGRDNSTIEIIDFTPKTPKLVASYCSDRIAPDNFAYEIKALGNRYGHCLMGVERNNHGHATLAVLKTIYNNIYSEIKTDKIYDTKTEKLGWHTNGATKPKMLYDLRRALVDECLEIPDKKTIFELRTYPKSEIVDFNKKDTESKHWDRVIALAIAWQMRTELDFEIGRESFEPKETDEIITESAQELFGAI